MSVDVFFETTPKGIVLRIRLQPGASCQRVAGVFVAADGTEFLKISVVSIPEKGKANQELLSWLAQKLKTAKSDMKIVSGEIDRNKKVLITADETFVLSALQALAEGMQK